MLRAIARKSLSTPIDFIAEARPLPRRVLRSPSGGPSTSSGPCAIFKRSGLAVGGPMYGPALGDGISLVLGLDLVVSSTLALDAIHDGEW